MPDAMREPADLIAALLDTDRGFVLIKNHFTIEEVDAYRRDCEQFLLQARTCYTRINSNTRLDYVHPRSHDRVTRTYRIYQYLHNLHPPSTESFLKKGFALRNQLEQGWLDNPQYRAERERLQDYIIVTKYVADTGMLPRHHDYEG